MKRISRTILYETDDFDLEVSLQDGVVTIADAAGNPFELTDEERIELIEFLGGFVIEEDDVDIDDIDDPTFEDTNIVDDYEIVG